MYWIGECKPRNDQISTKRNKHRAIQAKNPFFRLYLFHHFIPSRTLRAGRQKKFNFKNCRDVWYLKIVINFFALLLLWRWQFTSVHSDRVIVSFSAKLKTNLSLSFSLSIACVNSCDCHQFHLVRTLIRIHVCRACVCAHAKPFDWFRWCYFVVASCCYWV